MAQNNFSIATTYHEIKRSIGCYKQRDQIGRFLKFFATKFVAKGARMICNILGNFEKPHSCVKLFRLLYRQLLEKIGLLFTPTSGHTRYKSCY